MSQVTLEMVRARQRDLTAMIDELAKREQQPLELPACTIALRAGEWYAGAALHADGRIKHHTIVCAADNSGRDHADANAWAAAQGGDYTCPDKQDARLILANRHEGLDAAIDTAAGKGEAS